jgi:hypothetical protein
MLSSKSPGTNWGWQKQKAILMLLAVMPAKRVSQDDILALKLTHGAKVMIVELADEAFDVAALEIPGENFQGKKFEVS